MSQFAEKIIKVRKERNLTQKQLAKMLDIRQSTLSTWETGKVIPLIIDVVRLAEALDTSAEELTLLIVKDISSNA